MPGIVTINGPDGPIQVNWNGAKPPTGEDVDHILTVHAQSRPLPGVGESLGQVAKGFGDTTIEPLKHLAGQVIEHPIDTVTQVAKNMWSGDPEQINRLRADLSTAVGNERNDYGASTPEAGRTMKELRDAGFLKSGDDSSHHAAIPLIEPLAAMIYSSTRDPAGRAIDAFEKGDARGALRNSGETLGSLFMAAAPGAEYKGNIAQAGRLVKNVGTAAKDAVGTGASVAADILENPRIAGMVNRGVGGTVGGVAGSMLGSPAAGAIVGGMIKAPVAKGAAAVMRKLAEKAGKGKPITAAETAAETEAPAAAAAAGDEAAATAPTEAPAAPAEPPPLTPKKAGDLKPGDILQGGSEIVSVEHADGITSFKVKHPDGRPGGPWKLGPDEELQVRDASKAPVDPDLHRNLANMLSRELSPEEAAAAARRAIETHPDASISELYGEAIEPGSIEKNGGVAQKPVANTEPYVEKPMEITDEVRDKTMKEGSQQFFKTDDIGSVLKKGAEEDTAAETARNGISHEDVMTAGERAESAQAKAAEPAAKPEAQAQTKDLENILVNKTSGAEAAAQPRPDAMNLVQTDVNPDTGRRILPVKPGEVDIPRTPIHSRGFNSYGYDPATRTLDVEFTNGNVYRYYDVPEKAVEAASNAESRGAELLKLVRKYPGTRQGTQDIAQALTMEELLEEVKQRIAMERSNPNEQMLADALSRQRAEGSTPPKKSTAKKESAAPAEDEGENPLIALLRAMAEAKSK